MGARLTCKNRNAACRVCDRLPLYICGPSLTSAQMLKRGIISFVVMIALAMVGFGHKSLTPAADAQATAYILAGGSWSDLCGQDGDPRHASADQCRACVISHGCLLDTPAVTAATLITASALVARPYQSISHLSGLDWAYAARAPPVA